MQMIFIIAAFIVAVILAFAAVWYGGKWALRKWDAHTVLNHARQVERDAKKRDQRAQRASQLLGGARE